MQIDQTLTLGMTARLVGRSKTTVCRAIQSGKLPATKKEDGSYSIKPDDATRFAKYAARPISVSDQMALLPLFSNYSDDFDLSRFLARVTKERTQNKLMRAALQELLQVHLALCRVAGFSNVDNRKEIIAARSALNELEEISK